MTTANAVSEATSEDWYAAEQSKSLLKNIVRRNNNLSTPSSTTTTTTSEQAAATTTERNLGSFYDNFYAARKSRGFTTLKKYAPPSNYEAINSLDSYSEFWIDVTSANFNTQERAGPCVWSECEIDAVDEEYMGDNRDGDEQWYQFRTQQFCANAAFTLYGRKKYENFIGRFGNQCSERHFINSFFTYGGSDNLLKALGQTPTVYYQGDGASSNADCMYSNDDGSYSTLGCSSDGEYIVGYFGGNTCDGNYFTGGSNFNSYTNAFQSAKCQSVDADTVYKLLSISWACDVRLYPNGQCPDVWGRKSFYEYALAVAHEGASAKCVRYGAQLMKIVRRLHKSIPGIADSIANQFNAVLVARYLHQMQVEFRGVVSWVFSLAFDETCTFSRRMVESFSRKTRVRQSPSDRFAER